MLACGKVVGDELGDDYTLYMSRVTCPACKGAVQAAIELLRTPSTPAEPPRLPTIAGELAQPGFFLHHRGVETRYDESTTSPLAGASRSRT